MNNILRDMRDVLIWAFGTLGALELLGTYSIGIF